MIGPHGVTEKVHTLWRNKTTCIKNFEGCLSRLNHMAIVVAPLSERLKLGIEDVRVGRAKRLVKFGLGLKEMPLAAIEKFSSVPIADGAEIQ